MTWKPTDGLVTLHSHAAADASEDYDEFCSERMSRAALIAVQPLIAKEAMERAAQIADAFVASSEEGPLDRVDTFQNMAAESIAAAIRFASGKSFVGIAAEARAKALEEAAKICDGKETEWERHLDDGWDTAAAICATEIRSLIPKPPEGT